MKLSSTIKVTVALTCLCLLVYFVGIEELWAALAELSLTMVVLLFALSFVLILISALKWRLFLFALGAPGTVPSVSRLFGLYLVGYFINLLAPSFVGGDAVRSYYAGKASGQHAAAAATILERFTGLVAMVVLAIALMWFSDLVTWEIRALVLFVGVGLLILALLAMWERAIPLVSRLPGAKRVAAHLEQVQSSFHLARRNHGLIARAMLLSLAFHSVTVVNTLAAGWAVGWFGVSVPDLFIVLPLILIIGAIPVAPSGLGIQEGAFFFFLQGIGASPGQALAVGVVLRAKSYVLAVLGGLVWYFLTRDSSREGPQAATTD